MFERNPEGYESPLCCSMLAAGEGWALRHTTDGAWPPDDVPEWMWGMVQTYLDFTRFQVLPYPGGLAAQPARLVSSFRILDQLHSEVVDSLKASRDFHGGKG